jgi:hypothetical protein
VRHAPDFAIWKEFNPEGHRQRILSCCAPFHQNIAKIVVYLNDISQKTKKHHHSYYAWQNT